MYRQKTQQLPHRQHCPPVDELDPAKSIQGLILGSACP